MISFQSKIVTIGALILFFYFLAQNYHRDQKRDQVMQAEFQTHIAKNKGQESRYTISIPAEKKYDNFSWMEKIVYWFYKDELGPAARAHVEGKENRKINNTAGKG